MRLPSSSQRPASCEDDASPIVGNRVPRRDRLVEKCRDQLSSFSFLLWDGGGGLPHVGQIERHRPRLAAVSGNVTQLTHLARTLVEERHPYPVRGPELVGL